MESGLQFDFSYGAGTSWQQIIAFETAGLMWSDYITDDMTVNIHVEMTSELPDNVIGGALPGMVADVNYADFRNAYHDDITSWRDSKGFDSLSLLRHGTKEKFEARIDFGSDYVVEDSSNLNMTRANAKALGLIAGDDAALDGYIMMNDLSDSSFKWSYHKERTGAKFLDFLSTAVHEIGHVLGFVSGVDKYEGFKFSDMDSFWNHFGTADALKKYTNSIVDYANPLDLFRYSQESLSIDNGRNTIDMSIGTEAFFGSAKLSHRYATGKNMSLDGDGFQASHWKQKDGDKTIGIMDPLMKPGLMRRISDRDLRAMDAIGYDINQRAENLIKKNVAENGWRSVTGENTSLQHLDWSAKKHIAKSLHSDGRASWVNQWKDNDPEYSSAMTSDKSNEIDRMIKTSKVYEGRRSGSRSSRLEVFFAESYFSSIDAQSINTAVESSLNLSPVEFMVEDSQSAAISQLLETDISQTDSQQDPIAVSTVDMELISLTENVIDTVSTDLNSELVEEDSLYSDRLEANLFSIFLA